MKLSSKDFHTLLRAADVADAQIELMDFVKGRSEGRFPMNRLTGPVLVAVAMSAALVFSIMEFSVGYEAPSTYVSELPEKSSALEG
jgi:hypothetical protein